MSGHNDAGNAMSAGPGDEFAEMHEAMERAGLAAWAAQLESLGHQATAAEYQFGWDHLPLNHRVAWVARARRVIDAYFGTCDG